MSYRKNIQLLPNSFMEIFLHKMIVNYIKIMWDHVARM